MRRTASCRGALKNSPSSNFGRGIEHETFVFSNMVLKTLPDGSLEGYAFDPFEFIRTLAGPDQESAVTPEALEEIVRRMALEISLSGLGTPDFVLPAQ